MNAYEKTPRTTLRRLPKRGTYDRAAIHAILDEGFICHVGFVVDGAPAVIPTAYGRAGETLYIHGSAGNRMLRNITSGEACVSVTLVDGLVMARSAFHHSINYRSVVIYGAARQVTDPEEKMAALRCISDHIAPGRWAEVREPNEKELAVTNVVAIPLNEVSAKVRTGPPADDDEDHALDVWAGVLPLSLTAGTPVRDEQLRDGIPVPASVAHWSRAAVTSRE